MGKNKLKLIIFLIICSIIIISNYYVISNFEINKESNKNKDNKEISIDFLIKEDKAAKWHNNTIIKPETSLFEITQKMNKVDYFDLEYGKYIIAINGIKENKDTNQYWIWWKWNDELGWIQGNVGSDQFKINRNMTLAWTLIDTYKNEKP